LRQFEQIYRPSIKKFTRIGAGLGIQPKDIFVEGTLPRQVFSLLAEINLAEGNLGWLWWRSPNYS